MRNSKLVLTGILFAAVSTASYAAFSTSEFGSGSFNTGSGVPLVPQSTPSSVDDGICGVGSACTSTTSNALNAIADDMVAAGSATSDGSDEQDRIINFFDTSDDGTLTASEVVSTFANISGVSFTYRSKQQAAALLRGVATHCSSEINEACLIAAAGDGDDFIDDAVTTATPAQLTSLKNAFASSSTTYAVTDSHPLKIFDANDDGTLSESEFVTLLATDKDAGSSVNTTGSGLFARAYATEIASGSTLSAAVSAGNSWAVHPPQIANTPSGFAMSGTSSSSQTSTAMNVYDGTCGASDPSSCTANPANVTHTITQTHTPIGGTATAASGAFFSVNTSGQITLASGVSIQDLDAGTYALSITSTDANTTQTYNQSTTTPTSVSLTVSNENGCIMSTDVANSDFNASGSISGAAVTISGGHDATYDKLFIKGATSSYQQSDGSWSYSNIPNPSGSGTLSGITARYVPSSGMLRFYGSQTKAQWVALFDSVGYIYNNSGSGSSKNLIFSLSNKVPFLHDNNTPSDSSDDTYHFYDYIAYGSGDNRNHTNAISTAQNTSLMGLTGYLATITSQAEQDYINPKVRGHGWLGACDDLGNQSAHCNNVLPSDTTKRDEGEWYWIDGPEKGGYMGRASGYASNPAGQAEWNNGSWDSTGATYSYTNWAGSAPSGEPNNVAGGCSSTREDALHVWSWKSWNDYCRSNGSINGYLIEWGGPSNSSWGQVNGSPISFTTTKTYNPATQGTFCAHQ